jgi:hypothetical protein
MTKSTPATKTVPVKSAWTSKINWANIIAFLGTGGSATLWALFGVDAVTAIKLAASFAMAGQVITFVLRTWFTASVLTPSVSK